MLRKDTKWTQLILVYCSLSAFFSRGRSFASTRVLSLIVCCSSTLLYSGASLASSDSLSEADLKAYQEKISGSDFLSVDFTQSRYTSLRQKIRKSQGTARFSKPDKFRWRLETPIPDQWIFNGKTLYNYNPATKQAIKYSTGGKADQLTEVVDLVMNFDTLLKRYSLESAKRVNDQIQVVLKPKGSTDITRVDLQIDEKKNYVSSLKMYLGNGNYTALDFLNPIRTKIDESEYSLPSGVTVTEGL